MVGAGGGRKGITLTPDLSFYHKGIEVPGEQDELPRPGCAEPSSLGILTSQNLLLAQDRRQGF